MSIMKNVYHTENIKFFILAGGYGKRAKPLSLVKPKPIFPLHGTPLIKILLSGLKNSGFRQGFINLHHNSEAIRECISDYSSLSIKFLYEEVLSGSKILTQALADMDEFLFVLNGDVFLEVTKIPVERILHELLKTGSDGALLVQKDSGSNYSSIITEKGVFLETGKNNEEGSFMYTGAALFRRNIIEKIDDVSFFNTLRMHNFKIRTFVYDGIWLDIGNPSLYFDSNTKYKNYLKSMGNVSLTQSNSLSENVNISTSSDITHCIVWENTNITGNSTLSDCIITGNLTLHNASYFNKIIYVLGSEMKTGDFEVGLA